MIVFSLVLRASMYKIEKYVFLVCFFVSLESDFYVITFVQERRFVVFFFRDNAVFRLMFGGLSLF